ncbi:MAG: cofactor-independent phosphoglycerate mutase [Phycisphaerae bacterium]
MEPMKYVIIIPDGCADGPIDELGARTPLEVADIPHMHRIAQTGRLGTVRTTPPDYSAGSDVCTMSLLGYDPVKYHPGRAPLEAAAMGLQLHPADWVFRCNLVTITDAVMQDHSAGHISDQEAHALLNTIRTALSGHADSPIQFHPGVSYRHLMTLRGHDFTGVKTTPPHDIPGQPVENFLPKGKGSELLKNLIAQSHAVLKNHEVNLTRRDLGENEATHIWLWGQGKAANIPTFAERFGKSGAMLTAVDLLRGIANLLGWQNIAVPGITSYHDTDYGSQGRATLAAIDQYDIVCTHIEAPDEASHQADFQTKIASLEAIDEHIVRPVLQKLADYPRWRVLIMPDHATYCTNRKHQDDPVPFAITGTHVPNAVPRRFTETDARASDLHVTKGHDLMDFFLHSGL